MSRTETVSRRSTSPKESDPQAKAPAAPHPAVEEEGAVEEVEAALRPRRTSQNSFES
jgi:hypothetical protein